MKGHMKEPSTSTSLHEALQELHRELSATSALDEQSQKLIETVLQDIQRTLEANLPREAVEPDVVAKLEEAALAFELRHPTAAASGCSTSH